MSHFDDIAATWDDDPRKQARARHTAEAILAAVCVAPHHRILDFGGGTGLLGALLAAELGERGHLTVLDASAGMCAVAREKLAMLSGPSTDVVHAQEVPHRLPAQPYDVVVSSLAFHHIPDIPATLVALRALMEPGSTLVICELEPDPQGDFHRHHQDFHGHHGLSREQLRHDVVAAGFAHVTFAALPPIAKDVEGQEREFPMFMLVAKVE